MSNRLIDEPSLYLRQHAQNPVEWWPWCPEAFEEAQRLDRPVLVSIGYSSCHWCHVMERECFENDYIAGLMNQHFINIKVDREERPDVDQIYMDAVQMVTQQGGWPLNSFCLPDGRPFFGGTYFPPEDVGRGIIPWPQLLLRISKHYKEKKGDLLENAESILKNMAHNNNARTSGEGEWDNAQLLRGAQFLCSQHDDELGGFGDAPKFPPSMKLNYLLEVRNSAACEIGSPELAARIDVVVKKSLSAMAQGGLYDQLGGGFTRYSVDAGWKIPHFEKMLYDNGLLLDIFTKGWLRYRDPLFRAVVTETIAWIDREMRADNGGFFSSLDADSEGVEGKSYVWNPKQINEALGDKDGQLFCDAYDISEDGNFEHGLSNPVLQLKDFSQRQELVLQREKLLSVREQRVQPGKDTKQLTSWNGLYIRGLAEAGFTFGERQWLEAARRGVDWIWKIMRTASGRLHSVYYAEQGPRGTACLDDYAFTIEALLSIASHIDWLEPGSSATYLSRATELMDIVFKHFRDEKLPGFFFTADDHEKLVFRKKEWFDNAIPSGNSSLIHSLSCLHAVTGDSIYARELGDFQSACIQNANELPHGTSHAMSGLTAAAVGVAVIKIKGVQDLEPLREAIIEKPWRRIFLQWTDDVDQPNGYQLCVGSQCLESSMQFSEVLEKL